MSSKADRDWQLQMTEMVAKVIADVSEVKTNQSNLHEKINDHIGKSDARFDNLDKIVIGNGHRGLAEEVRSIKHGWGIIYTGLLVLINGLITSGIHFFMK